MQRITYAIHVQANSFAFDDLPGTILCTFKLDDNGELPTTRGEKLSCINVATWIAMQVKPNAFGEHPRSCHCIFLNFNCVLEIANHYGVVCFYYS